MLDHVSRWDEELNWDEQQSLMLARLLIQRPRWLVLDEMIDSIDGETRARAFEIFSNDLKDAAIIHIGRARAALPSFARVVHVVQDPRRRRLIRPTPAATTGLPSTTHVAAAS